jgi:HSP20 family protein
MSYPVRPSWRAQGGGRRDPFASLEAMQERFNRMLGDAITGYRGRTPLWHPDIDIDESEDGWVVEARLPGVAPDEVAIDINDRELVIRAVQSDETSERSRYSDFSYRLTVPSDVDPDSIDATMDHGLLVVRLPRSKTSHSRRITVARHIGQADTGIPDRPTSDVSEATASDAPATAAYDAPAPAGPGVSDVNPDDPIPTTEGKNLPGA